MDDFDFEVSLLDLMSAFISIKAHKEKEKELIAVEKVCIKHDIPLVKGLLFLLDTTKEFEKLKNEREKSEDEEK